MRRILQWLHVLVGSSVLMCLWCMVAIQPVQAQSPTPAPAAAKRDPEAYNYLPLILRPELSLTTPDNLKDVLIANLVLDQGYEVQCAAPRWHMAPGVFGDLKEYFEPANYKGPVKLKGNDDLYVVNMAKSRIAMMRGDEDMKTTNKISSLEALVGVVNPELPPDELNSKGAVYQLMPFEQQCTYKYKTMVQMWSVCTKLGLGSECFLNTVIPKSGGLTMANLMTGMTGAKTKYDDDATFCSSFMRGYDSAIHTERMGLSQSEFETFKNALQNYSIDQNFLYRVGFLVISVTQNRDDDGDALGDVFWFRKQPEDANSVLQAPIIVAFKIPDFATNKSQLMGDFKDTSKILNDLFWAPDRIDQINQDSLKVRSQNMSLIAANRDLYPIIKCGPLYPCPKNEPPELLQRAVIDIVNGLGTNCAQADMPIENAGDIGSPGLVTEDKRLPLPQYFNTLIPSDRSFRFNWELIVDQPVPPLSGQDMNVTAHVVIPWGTDLSYVESTLKAMFQPGVYETMEKENVMVDYHNKKGVPEYYPLKEAAAEFNTSTPQHSYTDYSQEPKCKYNQFNIWVCEYPTKQFGASISEEGKDQFRILGARFGWMIRKIQEGIRQPNLQIKCTRTEDLFLGRCKIESLGKDPNGNGSGVPSGADCPLELGWTQELEDKVISNKAKFMHEINLNYPGNLLKKTVNVNGVEMGLFDYVLKRAKEAGWNPAIFLALGREETAWGAVGNIHIFGCMAGTIPDNATPLEITNHQIDCVLNSFNTSMSCEDFMCKYSGDAMQGPCVIEDNPEFALNLPGFYRSLVE